MSKKSEATLRETVESDVYDVYVCCGIKMIRFWGYFTHVESDDACKETLGAPRYACYYESNDYEMPLVKFIRKYGCSWNKMYDDNSLPLTETLADELTYKSFLKSAKSVRQARKRLDFGKLTNDTPEGEYYSIYQRD